MDLTVASVKEGKRHVKRNVTAVKPSFQMPGIGYEDMISAQLQSSYEKIQTLNDSHIDESLDKKGDDFMQVGGAEENSDNASSGDTLSSIDSFEQ